MVIKRKVSRTVKTTKKPNIRRPRPKKDDVSAVMPSRFSTWRENTVLLVFVGIGCLMLVRAGFLQIFEKEYLQSEGNNRYLRVKKTEPLRGIVKDRSGRPLAVSSPVDTIWINPKIMLERKEVHQFDELARLSGKARDEFYRYLKKNAKLESIILKRGVSPDEAKYVKGLKIASVTIKKELVGQAKGDQKKETLASITARPQVLLNEQDKYSYRRLAKRLGMQRSELNAHLRKNSKKEFAYLKRHLSPKEASEVLALGIAGVNKIREYRRYYPAGPVASHILGFTDIDNKGQEGIELVKNNWLNGDSGRSVIMQDRVGRIVEQVERVSAVKHGEDLQLSIDARIQYLAYRHLKAAIKKSKAASGSLVALDAHSGQVLAMVNMPDFNPNDRSDMQSQKFRNRAITDLFEPGSTIKPFTVAAAIEKGVVEPETIIETNGVLHIGGNSIEDTKNHGDLTVSEVIQKSSNIGSAKIAAKLNSKTLQKTLSQLGFGEKTTLELNGQRSGVLNKKRRLPPIGQATLSYGYGLSVTALQLARAYTALAGDGRVLPVSLIMNNKKREVKGKRVFSSDTVDKLRPMLRDVVSLEGTAPQAMMGKYSAAGKTGTVHKVKRGGGYHQDKYLSLFAGFAPVEDPEVVMVVIVDDPRGDDYYGGRIAGPVFSRVMEGALRFRNVKPDRLPLLDKDEGLAKIDGKQMKPVFEVVQ